MKTSHLRFLTFFCLTVFISLITVKSQHVSLSASTRNSFSFSSLPSKISESKPDCSFPGSHWSLLFTEEIEENEEVSKKSSLPIFTFAYLFRTLYFTEIQNHYFVFQPEGGSSLSIPLHIKNCIYLI